MDPRKFPAKPRTMERRSDQRRAPRTPPLRSRRTFRAATANPDSRELEKLFTSRALGVRVGGEAGWAGSAWPALGEEIGQKKTKKTFPESFVLALGKEFLFF